MALTRPFIRTKAHLKAIKTALNLPAFSDEWRYMATGWTTGKRGAHVPPTVTHYDARVKVINTTPEMRVNKEEVVRRESDKNNFQWGEEIIQTKDGKEAHFQGKASMTDAGADEKSRRQFEKLGDPGSTNF